MPDNEHMPNHAVAMELWRGVEARDYWPALRPKTVKATIERYKGDELGAAMAIDITHALAPELSQDGILDDIEAEPIDEIVDILRRNGLAGVDIESLAEVLGINFEMGALEGIVRIHSMLSDASLGNVTELQKHFEVSTLAEDEENDVVRDLGRASLIDILELIDDSDYNEYPEDETAEEDSNDRYISPQTTTVKDESGEEFEI